MVEARSDVVGSLLRPARLLEARQRFAGGELSTAEFKVVEDDAVDEALRLQHEAGVEVVTDGEMRRLSFQSQLPAAVEGFSDWDLDAFLWGDWQGDEAVGDLRVERPALAVVGKLRRRRSLCAEEFAYARGRTDRVLKVTLPSPSLFANFWDPERAPPACRTLEDFLADVAEVLREEADELEAMGATYLQLDALRLLGMSRRSRRLDVTRARRASRCAIAFMCEPGGVGAMTLDPDEGHLQEGAAALVRRLPVLRRVWDSTSFRLVTSGGEELDVPPALLRLLVAVAEELERGNGVSVLPLHRQVTTSEAAKLLNVSRPHVISLLERGDLPFEKVGTHHRVRLTDVLAYRQERDRRRREALGDMVRLGEDLVLEY